jgi:1-deoxy-D-xylulose-5-phosphate reductoisomerase
MSTSQPNEHRIAILGATGSIGTATVDVIEHLRRTDSIDSWSLYGISGHHNVDRLAEIAVRHEPKRVVISDQDQASGAEPGQVFKAERFPAGVDIRVGADRLVELAADPEVDIVVAAIVGRAGLESTLEAVRAGKRVAIANKETLVVAGGLVRELAAQSGAELLPVDSEHSAIFQCLAGGDIPRRIILTASGGPFRDWSVERMREATIEQALAHPTWKMGRKISIDSATMMNKALEIIEARWLFDCPAERIEVMIHPQSIIHSMVEMINGSTIAQLSPPDMRLPIQHALTHPRCLAGDTPTLDLSRISHWTLEPVDTERFPAIRLGFEVARVGGSAGAVVNAANEAAVGLFLDGRIRFTDIVTACRIALEHHTHENNPSPSRLSELDRWARAEVTRWLARSNNS